MFFPILPLLRRFFRVTGGKKEGAKIAALLRKNIFNLKFFESTEYLPIFVSEKIKNK